MIIKKLGMGCGLSVLKAGPCSVLIVGALISSAADAKSGNPPPADTMGQAESPQEIIVTAQHRDTSIHETPIAISAFGSEKLESSGITTVEGLTRIEPSLQIYSEQVNNEEYIIRGIGKANEDLATDSGVAVNVNGAYIAQSGEANAAIFDIERVEVLRGPQGTLYGKNAVGGVVNIITRKPTDRLDGYLLNELGGLGRRQFEGAVSGPLVDDKLSARIAGFSLHTNGAYRNLTTGHRANDVDTQAIRGSLRFTPNDAWEINLTADYSKVEQDGVLKSVIADVPGTLLIGNDSLAGPYATQEEDIRSGRSNVEGAQGIKQWGGVSEINRSAAGGTLSLISAYRRESSYNVEDADRTAADQVVFAATQKTWAISQELRFVSDDAGTLSAGGKLHWSAGLYWFHEEGWRNQDVRFVGCTIANRGSFDENGNFDPSIVSPCDPFAADNPDDGLLGAGTPDYQNSTARFLQRINTDSVAAYGEAKYDVTSHLSATLGLRYTVENKKFGLDASSVANVAGGDPYSVFLPEGDFRQSSSKTWRKFTPKFVLQFEPSRSVHMYASYARGFKSGGFNGQAGTAVEAATPFDPETADSFELGIKSDLLDRRLTVNASAFYIKFDNLQVSGVDENGSPLTDNAANAVIKGIELNIWAQPFSGFTLNGSLSLLDPTYRDYRIAIFDPSIQGGPPFRLVDMRGERMYNVAKYAGSVGAQYEHGLGNGSQILLGSDIRFRGDTKAELSVRSKSFVVMDVRLGWKSSDQRWEVTGWIRNLTNKIYYPGGGSVPDYYKDSTRVGLVADPRTGGVTVKLNFGK